MMMTKTKKTKKPTKTTSKAKYAFWISGNIRQRQQVWEKLCSKVKEKTGSDPHVISVFAGHNPEKMSDELRWSTARDVVELLRNPDMFDPRPRIIKVIGVPANHNLLLEYLPRVNSKNMLVMWGNPSYIKPGASKQTISVKTSKLYKAIVKDGMICSYPTEAKTNGDAARWSKEIAESYGKNLTDEAAKFLVRIQGKNLDLLENYVDKLCVYKTGKKIDEKDVSDCCSPQFLEQVWGYLDNLDMQNLDKSLSYLEEFYEAAGTNVGESFYGEVSNLLGALFQHYFFLSVVKDVSGSSIDYKRVEAALKDFKKFTPLKIKELGKKKITVDDLAQRFTGGFLYANSNKPSIRQALRHKKSTLYTIFLDLLRSILLCRIHSGNPSYIKLVLTTFTLLACGRLNLDEVSLARGFVRGKARL